MKPRADEYILDDDNNPVVCADTLVWGEWTEASRRNGRHWVARTKVGKYIISTIFLGLDHNFTGYGPPILFESMVFIEDRSDEDMFRYQTYAAAKAGHERLVKEYEARTGKKGKEIK